MKTQMIRLPKKVESDPRGSQLLRILNSDTRALWQGGEIEVPLIRLSPEIAAALRIARSSGRLARGLQAIERKLDAEERGLRLADLRSDVPRGVRVSRLLLLTEDGAERFYRQIEALLRRQGTRVLAVCLAMEAGPLGEMLFGTGHLVRLLMIEHKDAVCEVLLAMAPQECRDF